MIIQGEIMVKNEFLEMLNDFFPRKVKISSGELIKIKRMNYGLTLKEVEEITGISQNNLSLYENNKKNLGYIQATKIGLAIGLHPMTILFPNGIDKDIRFKEIAKRSQKVLRKKIPLKKAIS